MIAPVMERKKMRARPRFFARSADFRCWLERNAAMTSELLVGFHKVGSGRPSMSWPVSVDEALCFGWIVAARRYETRARRLEQLIAACAARKRL